MQALLTVFEPIQAEGGSSYWGCTDRAAAGNGPVRVPVKDDPVKLVLPPGVMLVVVAAAPARPGWVTTVGDASCAEGGLSVGKGSRGTKGLTCFWTALMPAGLAPCVLDGDESPGLQPAPASPARIAPYRNSLLAFMLRFSSNADHMICMHPGLGRVSGRPATTRGSDPVLSIDSAAGGLPTDGVRT